MGVGLLFPAGQAEGEPEDITAPRGDARRRAGTCKAALAVGETLAI